MFGILARTEFFNAVIELSQKNSQEEFNAKMSHLMSVRFRRSVVRAQPGVLGYYVLSGSELDCFLVVRS